jgi:hypothetical protein
MRWVGWQQGSARVPLFLFIFGLSRPTVLAAGLLLGAATLLSGLVAVGLCCRRGAREEGGDHNPCRSW